MEPALDTLDRALHGDEGARAFLERTSSIYLLDVTDPKTPKTYGCWNFIHQAMNAIERFEANAGNSSPDSAAIVGHARLLATVALRVARRSPASDKKLVRTCLANSEQYFGTPDQAQRLIDLNHELRGIVMGRIAAMAFDFNFHRQDGSGGRSAFADSVVLDMLCGVLSANAVSSGPSAIHQFTSEWIIPSSRCLPAFAVAAVVLHLSQEGRRRTAPAGTKDTLQNHSMSVVSTVLVPILAEAVSESSISLNQTISRHEASSQVATVCLQALSAWCDVTGQSLPQIKKHTQARNDIDIVTVLTDLMYSDSSRVLDALAEAFESLIRHTMVSSADINCKEGSDSHGMINGNSHMELDTSQPILQPGDMDVIIFELASSVGMQRFRFMERHNTGQHDVCRSLARIAASMCTVWLEAGCSDDLDRGLIDLLHKAAGHPSIHISALALTSFADLSKRGKMNVEFLLPVLQRRAIIPHQTEHGVLSLATIDLFGAVIGEYEVFRETVLSDILSMCFDANMQHYMDSCVSAVEEFCLENPMIDLSFQLEAALYCIAVVGDRLSYTTFGLQLQRLMRSLQTKSVSLLSNPITLSSMCLLLRKTCHCYSAKADFDCALDLTLTAFSRGGCQCENFAADTSPARDALLTLGEFLKVLKSSFVDESRFKPILDIWEASHMHRQGAGNLAVDARIALGTGIIAVIVSLPDGQRDLVFDLMIAQLARALEHNQVIAIKSKATAKSEKISSKIADDIRVLSSVFRAYADSSQLVSCSRVTAADIPLPDSAIMALERAWPLIVKTAEQRADFDDVRRALGLFLSDLLPQSCETESSRNLLLNLLNLSQVMSSSGEDAEGFINILPFLEKFVRHYGRGMDTAAWLVTPGPSPPRHETQAYRLFNELFLSAVSITLNKASPRETERKQGQLAVESISSIPRQQFGRFDELAGFFSLHQTCIECCPYFLSSNVPTYGEHNQEESILCRTIMLAARVICDDDPNVGRQSMKLITATAKYLGNRDGLPIARLLVDLTPSLLRDILQGCCGRFERQRVLTCSELLEALLQLFQWSEIESDLMSALEQGCFKLGSPCIQLTHRILQRVVQAELKSTEISNFFEQIWDLHQVDDTDALPESDAVFLFLRAFSHNGY